MPEPTTAAKSEVPLSTATAAPSEITLDGKPYIISKLTLRDLGYIEQWMRDSLVASGRENIKDPELTKSERVLILQEAYAAAAKTSLGTDYAMAMLESVEGMLRLAWFSLRKENRIQFGKTLRNMTLDDVADLLHSREALESIVNTAGILSGFDFATGDALPESEDGGTTDPANPPSKSPNQSAPTQEQSSALSPKLTTGDQK